MGEFNVNYPKRTKLVVLLGGLCDNGDFQSWYLGKHKHDIIESQASHYTASLITEDAKDTLEALKKTGGEYSTPWEILAVDSIYGADWADVSEYYNECRVTGVYKTTEYLIRELFTDRPLGVKSPEPERIGILKGRQNISHEDAMRYWIEQHPSLVLKHHTGIAAYSQSHIDEILLPFSPVVDGFNSHRYWNVNALRYGHFSQPDSWDAIREDCENFRSITWILLADHYIMK